MNLKSLIFLFIWLTFALTESIHGQSVTIFVKDHQGASLPGAVIQLSGPDSVRLIRVTDLDGVARFDRVTARRYSVRITFIGYQPLEEIINVTTGNREFSFKMSEDNVMMKEIVVSARRPLIKQEEDKMIIDIESVASISTNTLEILESTPGLIVDQDGGIFLNSTTPAMILINGREQKMSSQDIMTVLRSLPPGSVQRVEVLRTPSAKFSASSSGGIVNIILKRGVKIGRFGSVRTGVNQGKYGNRFAGVSLNNSGIKSTGYINFEISNNDMLEELDSERQLKPDTILYQSAETRRRAQQGFIGYGISYDAGSKFTFSYDGRFNGSLPKSSAFNSNIIKTTENLQLSESVNNMKSNSSFISLRQEFGALYRIDTAGSELDTRISFAYNNNRGAQDYLTEYLLPSLPSFSGDMKSLQERFFAQLQSDFAYLLPFQIKLETGYNGTWQNYSSITDYFITSGGVRKPDDSRTGRYSYREYINSGYLQASRELIWRLLFKAGLRLEHTYMKGFQEIPSDTSFLVLRYDWFPYAYLSRELFNMAGYEIRAYAIYRKTIARPGYESLNPSVRYVDQFFYETGNPALKPQFTENMEVNVSIDDMPIFAFGSNYTRNIFSSVIYRDSRNENIAVRTFDNLGKNKETYFRITGGIPPTRRYFFYVGAQYNRNRYEGYYEGAELRFDRGNWRFFTFHSLKITEQTRFTLNGFLMTKGQMNLYEMNTFGQLNLGLKQTFFNNKLSVTLSLRDALRTMKNEFSLNQGSINTTGRRYSDTRRFGININYNFGIPEKKEKERKINFEMDL